MDVTGNLFQLSLNEIDILTNLTNPTVNSVLKAHKIRYIFGKVPLFICLLTTVRFHA